MTISENYLRLRAEIPEAVKILVVSKHRSLEDILELYEAGVRDFGENRLPEALEKMARAPDDIRWHFIGNLQSKKVAKVVGYFHAIHSVDSFNLAELISKVSLKEGLQTQVYLQVNTSGEEAKSGDSLDAWRGMMGELRALPNLDIKGLMTMAPFIDDEVVIRECFSKLREFRDELSLKELSMGMSQDYQLAIEEGTTCLRLGSLVFNS